MVTYTEPSDSRSADAWLMRPIYRRQLHEHTMKRAHRRFARMARCSFNPERHRDVLRRVLFQRVKAARFGKLAAPGESKRIIALAAEWANTTPEQLIGTTRERCITRARQFAVYMIKQRFPKLSVSEVAHRFKRDHSTALHAYRKVREDLASDGELFGDIKSYVEDRL